MSSFHTFHPQNQSEAYLSDVSPPQSQLTVCLQSLCFPFTDKYGRIYSTLSGIIWLLCTMLVLTLIPKAAPSPPAAGIHLFSPDTDSKASRWRSQSDAGGLSTLVRLQVVEGSRSYPMRPFRSHPCLGFSRRGS